MIHSGQIPALTGAGLVLQHRLREHEPVARVTVEGAPAWLVTRYHEVAAALSDQYPLALSPSHAHNEDYVGFTLPPQLAEHLLAIDGAQHARLRGLIAPHLSAHRLSSIEPVIREHAQRLVGTLRDEIGADLRQQLVVPLPIAVLSDVLGLPEHARQTLITWAQRMQRPAAPRARDELGEMVALLHGLLDTPTTSGLLADLRAAHQAGQCSTHELTALLFYLVFVFLEPALDALTSVLLRALETPDRAVWTDPHRRVWAVDEALRFDSPQLLAAPRFVTEDLEIDGVDIQAGSTVLLSIVAANRDPRVFTNPEHLNPARRPNPHLSLGRGGHACPASALTRQLLDVAINTLLATYPYAQLGVPARQIQWQGNFRHHGPATLPVRLV